MPALPKRLKVRFWGVRGSIPCPGPSTARTGGNTSCLEVLGAEDPIILDAGTGIRELGQELARRKGPLRIHLLISHTHWDHIQGFPFFAPIYRPGNEIHIYGPGALEKTLEEALMVQMQYAWFPVRGIELAARLHFHQLDEETFPIGDVEVATKSMNHPIKVLAYKFRRGASSGAYTGDNEPYYDVLVDRATRADEEVRRRAAFIRDCNAQVADFFRGVNLLVADAQYTDEEYQQKRGWGHSPVSHVVGLAADAGVRRLALFHHEPLHDDRQLAAMAKEAARIARTRSKKLKTFLAKEGMVVEA